jgi:3-isopropylmalate/(R)-2-methylmalate dehydratase small subunit
MQPFTTLDAVAVPLDDANIDTDQIVPARFLKRPRGPDYARFLFHDLRFDAEGNEKPDFPLNRAPWREARILVADANFGCGSSREQAVWALTAYGIRAVIAPSFGDIFYNNSLKVGLLPIVLPADTAARLRHLLAEAPGAHLAIDLAAQTVTAPDRAVHRFDIDAFEKRCLLEGLDDIRLTLRYRDEIERFERRHQAEMSWLPLLAPS